ncbi:MAG: hypothetical protein JKY65_14670 [Planctomycetes bacterium]|nr:hypothetical protein [Planctomycetota bacterium]
MAGLKKQFVALADEWGGHYLAGDLLTDACVRFPAGRLKASFSVQVSAPGGNGSSELSFNWSPRRRLFLRPERLMDSVAKLIGYEDHQIGDATFDKAFLIQGSPESWVHDTLNPETRAHLLRLGKLTKWRGPILSVNQKEGTSFRFSTRLATSCWGEVVATSVAAMRSMTPNALDVICVACSQKVLGRLRRCRECESPHHRRCWERANACHECGPD